MRGCLSRIRGSESAQLAQYAALWDRTALRKPNLPNEIQQLPHPHNPFDVQQLLGTNSTRLHREQQRIVLTYQVLALERNSWPSWQHKTTTEPTRTGDLAQQDRTECSSVLACRSLVMKCACPKSAPKTTTPCLFVISPIAFPHHCVGVCDSCDAFTTGWASATLILDLCLPQCNEIPARVHNWCTNARCAIAVRSGCENK